MNHFTSFKRNVKYFSLFLIAILLSSIVPHEVKALPSYARQTGLACNVCHITFPQLNQFGRAFKLNAYTLSTMESVEAKNDSGDIYLKLMRFLPFSSMLQVSATQLSKPIPGKENGTIDFPQQLSFLMAGEITPKLGIFLQITYDDVSGAFSWDNTDLRYADNTSLFSKDFTWGISLNNNPSVQDLWHTTPAWSYPFASSPTAPAPAAAPILAGSLAGQVLGIGAYTLWDNLLYLELSVYKSATQGGAHPPDTSAVNYIKGIAPYWRAAIQHIWDKNYLSVGTYGMLANTIPAGISGSADKYTDIGVDLQYELQMDNDYITAYLTWLHENQDLTALYNKGAAQNSSNNLSTIKLTAGYFFANMLNLNLGYFKTTGSADSLVYAQSPVNGYFGGKPDSDGIIGEFGFIPWYNTRFALQYVYYTKFNGAVSNYDGTGRNAKDNNTLYLMCWVMF